MSKLAVLISCRSPGGPGIRLDGAMATGNIVGTSYDSLLVKVSSDNRQHPKLSWGVAAHIKGLDALNSRKHLVSSRADCW